MSDTTSDEILAAARASNGRRFLGLGSLLILGVMLIYVGFTGAPELVWRVFLICVGAAALWLADRMRRSTASEVQLTQTDLRDSDGTVIVRIDDIVGIDRGAFAFKPSNGFLLKTAHPAERVWRPGLWWRIGRRVGVGGMTPGHQTKVMSEIIAVKLAQRAGDAP